MAKYICTVCGYVYDEEEGIPSLSIAAKTRFEDLPEDFKCPVCQAGKSAFQAESVEKVRSQVEADESEANYERLSDEEIRAILSNLKRASGKQYKLEQAELFGKLVKFYDDKIDSTSLSTNLTEALSKDLDVRMPKANAIIDQAADRGAKRALVWSEKVTRLLDAHMKTYKDKTQELVDTNIYVCDICGYIHIGDEKPEVCPVCKVPSMKILSIEEVQAL